MPKLPNATEVAAVSMIEGLTEKFIDAVTETAAILHAPVITIALSTAIAAHAAALADGNGEHYGEFVMAINSAVADMRGPATVPAETIAASHADVVTALQTLIDCVDYEGEGSHRACGPAEMVGAVLPKDVLNRAKEVAEAGRKLL